MYSGFGFMPNPGVYSTYLCGLELAELGTHESEQYLPILPEHHSPNLASRILSLCERRLAQDWPARFGHPLWLLETFVDPRHFHGTIYRAANWVYAGDTRGFRRTRKGVQRRGAGAQAGLSAPVGSPRSGPLVLPDTRSHLLSWSSKTDVECRIRAFPTGLLRRYPRPAPRSGAASSLAGGVGHRHRRCPVWRARLQGYSEWADDLGQKARARFRCRYRDGRYEVPSRTLFREVLTRVDPASLDLALQGWNRQFAAIEEGLAIDGKTDV